MSKGKIKPIVPRYIRKSVHTVPEIFNFIKDHKAFKLDGDLITPSSRYRLFYRSLVCVKCGLVGTYFAKEKNPNVGTKYHLNLYAVKDGVEIQFTKDHILPKSKGGENKLSNYQTMCEPCNKTKGNMDNHEYFK